MRWRRECLTAAHHRDADIAAALTTAINALGYGPTFTRGWSVPSSDLVLPGDARVLDAAVAILLLMRRRAVV
jgi:hypothetical protein